MITSCETALRWAPQNYIDNFSSLVQVMAWCCQAPSQYLSQCWPSSMPPYGVTRPQWSFRDSFEDRAAIDEIPNTTHVWGMQGSFCECAQPMRDDVTMQRHLSLAGRIHKMNAMTANTGTPSGLRCTYWRVLIGWQDLLPLPLGCARMWTLTVNVNNQQWDRDIHIFYIFNYLIWV